MRSLSIVTETSRPTAKATAWSPGHRMPVGRRCPRSSDRRPARPARHVIAGTHLSGLHLSGPPSAAAVREGSLPDRGTGRTREPRGRTVELAGSRTRAPGTGRREGDDLPTKGSTGRKDQTGDGLIDEIESFLAGNACGPTSTLGLPVPAWANINWLAHGETGGPPGAGPVGVRTRAPGGDLGVGGQHRGPRASRSGPGRIRSSSGCSAIAWSPSSWPCWSGEIGASCRPASSPSAYPGCGRIPWPGTPPEPAPPPPIRPDRRSSPSSPARSVR